MKPNYRTFFDVLELYFNALLARQPGSNLTNIYRIIAGKHVFTTIYCEDGMMDDKPHPSVVFGHLFSLEIDEAEFHRACIAHMTRNPQTSH